MKNYIIILYMSEYQKNKSIELRKKEAHSIRTKYPDKIPIIVEKDQKCKDVKEIDKKKFLVPSDLTMGQFAYVIRKRIKINAEKAIFLFINNRLPATSSPLSIIYDEHKNEDGFLYVTYSGENTFG